MVLLGYNSNGFRSHRLMDVIPWLADLGYQAIAITPDVGCLDPATTEVKDLEKVAELCRRLDLQVVVETGARYVLNPRKKHRPNLLEVSDDWKVRLDFLQQMLQWCDVLGSKVLSFWTGAMPTGQTEAGAMSRMVQAMEVMHGPATQYGVALGLEPEPGHWIKSLADWGNLKKNCSESLMLTLDIGHLLISQEEPVEEQIKLHKDYIVNVHVDDMERGIHHHLPLGEGEIDFVPVAHALNQLDSTVPACLELSRDSHRFHELAPHSIQQLKNLKLNN